MKPLIICLMGPTASGKTQTAIEWVQNLPLEIVSVDASMVYRGMDIGTAKPDADTLKIVPHHLIDICDPAQAYSAGQFCVDAVKVIHTIFAKGKIPLLVGGTMLYFHALQKGLSDLPEGDPAIREAIDQQAQSLGWASLHSRLAQVDPIAAARIHPHDAQRISRALEVFQLTGQSWMQLIEKRKPYVDYPFLNLALWTEDRSLLHQRIVQRVDDMLKKGWIEEVELLCKRANLSENAVAWRAVGYRQIRSYLQGTLTFDAMRESIIIATRQLAKRQLTWIRGMGDGVQRVEGDRSDTFKQLRVMIDAE
jgi:tRNA dimethylallyltransferase